MKVRRKRGNVIIVRFVSEIFWLTSYLCETVAVPVYQTPLLIMSSQTHTRTLQLQKYLTTVIVQYKQLVSDFWPVNRRNSCCCLCTIFLLYTFESRNSENYNDGAVLLQDRMLLELGVPYTETKDSMIHVTVRNSHLGTCMVRLFISRDTTD